jgi:hypothetical protein
MLLAIRRALAGCTAATPQGFQSVLFSCRLFARETVNEVGCFQPVLQVIPLSQFGCDLFSQGLIPESMDEEGAFVVVRKTATREPNALWDYH